MVTDLVSGFTVTDIDRLRAGLRVTATGLLLTCAGFGFNAALRPCMAPGLGLQLGLGVTAGRSFEGDSRVRVGVRCHMW